MSKRQHDQDDWSADSASLFRDVRRRLDANALERAPVEAVLARIKAGGHEAGSAVVQATGAGAARVWLGQAAKGAIVVVLLGAASYGGFRAISEPSATTSREEPAARAMAAAAGSGTGQPVSTPSVAPSDVQPDKAAVAHRKEPSRAAASPRRRSPSNVTSQRGSARAKSSAVETVALTRGDDTSSVSASSEDTTQQDGSERPAAVTEVAPKPSPAAWETKAREVTAPVARKADPPVHDEPNELALVKRIHAELHEARFSNVLSLCSEHERRWPHGMFELERQGARAIVLCGVRSGDAGRQASQFLAAYPHAPVTMRVKSACAMLLPRQ